MAAVCVRVRITEREHERQRRVALGHVPEMVRMVGVATLQCVLDTLESAAEALRLVRREVTAFPTLHLRTEDRALLSVDPSLQATGRFPERGNSIGRTEDRQSEIAPVRHAS